MKKIIFFIIVVLSAVVVKGQTISFEESEGYELGSIDGQGNWQADYDFFTVSDSKASDGDWSLMLGKDENNVIDPGFILGPVDILDNPIATGTYKISSDIYICPCQEGMNSQFAFFIADLQDGNLAPFGQIVIVDSTAVIVEGSDPMASAEVIEGAWNNLEFKLDFDSGDIEYYVNEDLVYSSQFTGSLQAIAFFTDGVKKFYVDHILGEADIDMGIKDFQVAELSHYNRDNQLYLEGQSQIGEVAIYNLLGQQVITHMIDATSGSIDLSSLSTGVYITKVAVNGQSKSFKFAKN